MKNKNINKYILGAMILAPTTIIMNNNEMTVVFADDLSDATNAVVTAEGTPSTANIASARELVNALPEGADKDRLQGRLNALTSITDVTMPINSATANVDIYIKCENMLSLSLNTNSVTFEDFGGTEDLEKKNAVTLSINSSLPYDVNAYLPTAIQGSRGGVMKPDTLRIKANSDSGAYKKFPGIGTGTSEKLVLLADESAGNGKTHGIDLKLQGGMANDADVYKATIKFEVFQK